MISLRRQYLLLVSLAVIAPTLNVQTLRLNANSSWMQGLLNFYFSFYIIYLLPETSSWCRVLLFIFCNYELRMFYYRPRGRLGYI